MKEPSSLTPGRLVVVNRLTSPHGLSLNGKYGIIRAGSATPGRLPVEIFAREVDGELRSLQPNPLVSLSSLNVDPLDAATVHRAGNPALVKYLQFKTSRIWETEGYNALMYRTSVELFEVPGFVPEFQDIVFMCTLMGYAGDMEGAIGMARRGVEHPDVVGRDPADTERNTMYCILADSLLVSGRIGEAFEAAMKMTGDGCPKTMKRKALWKIYECCREDEQMRERVKLAQDELHPGDGMMHGEGFIEPEYICGEHCMDMCTASKPYRTILPSLQAFGRPTLGSRLSRAHLNEL